jgi:hypothetical protein
MRTDLPAHLFGNGIQRVQDVFRQFACSLVPKLGMRPDGVLDQFEALDIGRLERRWRSHQNFPFYPGMFARTPAAGCLRRHATSRRWG